MLEAVALIIEAALSLISELLPSVATGSVSAVAKIVAMLEQIVPVVVKNLPNLIAPIQDIISVLQSTGPLTNEQMTALETMSASLDAVLVQAGKDDGLTDPLAPAAPAAAKPAA
jgi:phage-related protein